MTRTNSSVGLASKILLRNIDIDSEYNNRKDRAVEVRDTYVYSYPTLHVLLF